MFPIARNRYASRSGKSMAISFDPSSGGIGRRLNIPKNRLYVTIKFNTYNAILVPNDCGIKPIRCIRSAAIMAIITFVNGPTSETRARSFLPSWRLNGSIGTGFAPPKITGDPPTNSNNGIRIVIIGSMCDLGSNVNRPASRGVGSPSLSATKPCASS